METHFPHLNATIKAKGMAREIPSQPRNKVKFLSIFAIVGMVIGTVLSFTS